MKKKFKLHNTHQDKFTRPCNVKVGENNQHNLFYLRFFLLYQVPLVIFANHFQTIAPVDQISYLFAHFCINILSGGAPSDEHNPASRLRSRHPQLESSFKVFQLTKKSRNNKKM